MKALVSGAGIAGLSAALALARQGWDVHVIEKAAAPRDTGYMIDFFGPGYEAAERLGVIDALAARGYDFDAVEFLGGDGRHAATIDYGLARAAAGGKLFPIMRGDVEQVLLAAVPKAVRFSYGTEIAAIAQTPDAVRATLRDGQEVTADLLVGADGIHSRTRALLFGEEAGYLRFLGHHTAAYMFESETVRRGLEGRFRILAAPGVQAGFYDTGGGRLAAFFVHRSQEPHVPPRPSQALRAVYGRLGWVVPEALASMPDDADIYYDVVAQIEMERWSSGRVVLIGDAAYAVSLLAGQGASLAIAGATALGESLAAGGDVPEALGRFEQRFRPLVLDKQAAGRRTAEWFVPATSWQLVVRNAALNIVSWPPLMKLFGSFVGFGSKGLTARS